MFPQLLLLYRLLQISKGVGAVERLPVIFIKIRLKDDLDPAVPSVDFIAHIHAVLSIQHDIQKHYLIIQFRLQKFFPLFKTEDLTGNILLSQNIQNQCLQESCFFSVIVTDCYLHLPDSILSKGQRQALFIQLHNTSDISQLSSTIMKKGIPTGNSLQ